MSIVRVKHVKQYLVVLNRTVLDPGLRLQERGFLLALLTLPDDWRFNLRDLANRLQINKDTAGKYLAALQKAGYCQISKTRTANGRYEAEYVIREEPVRKSRTGSLSENTGPAKSDVLNTQRPNTKKRGGADHTSGAATIATAHAGARIPSSLRSWMRKEAEKAGSNVSFMDAAFWQEGEREAKKHGYGTDAIVQNWQIMLRGKVKPPTKARFFWGDYSKYSLYRLNSQRIELAAKEEAGELHPAVLEVLAKAEAGNG